MTEVTTREFVGQAAICAVFGVMVGVGFYITFLPYNLSLDKAVAVIVILFLAGGFFALSVKAINLWLVSGKTFKQFFHDDVLQFFGDADEEDDE